MNELRALKSLSGYEKKVHSTRSGVLKYKPSIVTRKVYDYEPTMCIGDTEQIESKVFSWTGLCIETCKNTGKMRIKKGFTVYFTDILNQFMNGNNTHSSDIKVKTRYEESTKRNDDNKWTEKHTSFCTGMNLMIDFIVNECGGKLYHHSLDNDIGFLKNTQLSIKNHGNKDYRFFRADTGYRYRGDKFCYNSKWNKITMVDTNYWVKTYTPTFHAECKAWFDANDIVSTTKCGYSNTKLDTLAKFAYNDPNYIQKHNSVDDAIDLFNVVKNIVKYEKTYPDYHVMGGSLKKYR